MQPDFFLQFHICEVTIEIVNIKIKTSFNIPRNLWDKTTILFYQKRFIFLVHNSIVRLNKFCHYGISTGYIRPVDNIIMIT